jgi:glycosyltransferase EpsF
MKKAPIRIVHVIGKWVGGGVEAVVMNYYRHIDKTKIQFDFICDNDSTNIPYEEIESLGGRVILIPPYQKIFSYQKELQKVLKENNYKIVHSHINTLSVFPLYAAKKVGIPVRIAHSHSTTNKKEWKKNLMKQFLRPFSKKYATDYMCCSELAGRWLFGNKEYDKGNVYLLNNAIDLDKFKYDEKIRKEVRKELNIKDDTLVIGHIGRFVAQKNHTFLIDIFNEIHKNNNDSILLLAGQGPKENEIKEKVKTLNLEKNVIFLGQRNDANRLYQAFDVFLLPSLYEGLPVVGVEAQASGLLCILSESMTQETKVLDTTTFISLEESSKEWSTKLLDNYKNFKRRDTTKEITNNNVNIKQESIKLENKYVEFSKLVEYE